jgi:hypothetical protein
VSAHSSASLAESLQFLVGVAAAYLVVLVPVVTLVGRTL